MYVPQYYIIKFEILLKKFSKNVYIYHLAVKIDLIAVQVLQKKMYQGERERVQKLSFRVLYISLVA